MIKLLPLLGLVFYIVAVSRAVPCAKERGLKPLHIWLAAIPLWFFNQVIAGPLILVPILRLLGPLAGLFYHSQFWQGLLVFLLIRIFRRPRKEADSSTDVGESEQSVRGRSVFVQMSRGVLLGGAAGVVVILIAVSQMFGADAGGFMIVFGGPLLVLAIIGASAYLAIGRFTNGSRRSRRPATGLRWIAALLLVFGIAYAASLFNRPRANLPKPVASANAERSQCLKHLKEIVLAFKIFAEKNDGRFPFEFEGPPGTKPFVKRDSNGDEIDPFRHFLTLSNQLGSTRLLTCPSDKSRKMAADWTSFRLANITYKLRTGPQVNGMQNNQNVLMWCPIHFTRAYCDSSVGLGNQRQLLEAIEAGKKASVKPRPVDRSPNKSKALASNSPPFQERSDNPATPNRVTKRKARANPRPTPEPLWQGKIPTIPVQQFTNAYAPTNGLVAWYPFNGNVQDESGNERHATNRGARFVPDRFGVSDGALRFDGKQFVDCGTNSVFELGKQGSLGCWMLPFERTGPLVGKDSLKFHDDIQLGVNPHNKARGKIAMAMSPKEGEQIRLATGPEITPGKWYHVLGQWDTNGFRLFVNGKQVAENTGDYRVHAAGHPLLIGRFQTSEYFKGIIDDVAIYNRALSGNEVESLHRYSELAHCQSRLEKQGLDQVNQLPTKLQLALMGRVSKDAGGNLSMSFKDSKIRDLSGLNGLPLTRLNLDGTGVADLTPLTGLRLRELKLWGTQVTNLQALSKMPINVLFVASPVVDLEPLRHCPLENLWILSKNLADISPLTGMELNNLWIGSDRLEDISALKGQPIEILRLDGCPSIADFSPLLECKRLKRLKIHPKLTNQIEFLRAHPPLTDIVNQ